MEAKASLTPHERSANKKGRHKRPAKCNVFLIQGNYTIPVKIVKQGSLESNFRTSRRNNAVVSFRKAGTHRLSSWLTWGGLRKVVNYIIWGNVSSYGREILGYRHSITPRCCHLVHGHYSTEGRFLSPCLFRGGYWAVSVADTGLSASRILDCQRRGQKRCFVDKILHRQLKKHYGGYARCSPMISDFCNWLK